MQSLQMNGKARLFTSSACCSMGFGLPGAIGAYFADQTKDIILIAGDGGLQMNIQELQTVVHNKIPLKIFLLNNNGYLAISLMQDNLFKGKYIGSNPQSGISNPNFVKLAEAYGFKTYSFNNNTELENGIESVLNEDGPILCEIMMVENQLLIPRVQSSKDKNGKIISNSLENMFPYLSEEEMKKIME
jgi:acetolactate synthase-1/2/3 large subunit